MAMVWPVPSSAQVVDAVGGADLGRGVSDRARRCSSASGVGDGVAAERHGIDDDGSGLRLPTWALPLSASCAVGA